MLEPKFHPSTHYEWRLRDSHWVCVSHPHISISLADFLWCHGFEIPDTIKYCLADSLHFHLKFRHTGGLINIFIHPLN